MHTRESLITALSDAAEIEHGITCQYLFAAFSLKTHPEEGGVDWPGLERIRGWKAELLGMARQEMAHHGLVCNLLLAIGGAPRFGHPPFPHPVRYCSPYSTFELLPFSEQSLERFACYERQHARPLADEPASPPSIGALYRAIRDGLMAAASENSKLLIGPLEHQIANAELYLPQGQYDVSLAKVSDLGSALSLVDNILEHDHYERILSIQREFRELTRLNPGFIPARSVASNPRVRVSAHAVNEVSRIEHPLTRAAAELFNASYEAMLLALTRLYGRTNETDAEVDGLIQTAFFPMMTTVIRPLGEVLTQMPLVDGQSAPTAGPCFEIPVGLPLQPFKRGAWTFLHEMLQNMAASCARLTASVHESTEPWARSIHPRLVLLSENIDRIAGNFERFMDLRREYFQHILKRLS